MKYNRHYIQRYINWRKPLNTYRLRYRKSVLERREYLINLINYLCYRDVD